MLVDVLIFMAGACAGVLTMALLAVASAADERMDGEL